MLIVDSAEKPSWSKNLRFLGDQITLPISQKPAYGHSRASFFCHRNTIFFNVGKEGVFQQNRLFRPDPVLAREN
jgi:hypothetical protein